MPTEKQLNASRANGAKSRGPITPEGKRNSSRNAIRDTTLASTVVLQGESRHRFFNLCASLTSELRPATAIESLFVQKMAVAQWRQMRLWNLEKVNLDLEVNRQTAAPGSPADTGDPAIRGAIAFRSDSHSNSQLTQMEMRYDRQFARALESLKKLRQPPPESVFSPNEPSI